MRSWPSVLALILFHAVAAKAVPVTFFFTGHVITDAINGCGGLVNCGLVTGTYTFDSAAPDQNPDPMTGLYAATNITFSIDGVPFFSSANGFINVANFPLVDQYGLLAMGIAANGSPATLSILLTDPTAAAFSSDALPSNPGTLTPLLPGTFQLNAADDTFQLQGSIDAITALTPGMGFVQICKVAGSGVAPGTNFAFSVGGTAVTVAAGAPPNGTCGALLQQPAGTVTISETVPAGVVLTSVQTAPSAALLNADSGTGAVSVKVAAAGLTIVTFTDTTIANTGTVQVCKVGGGGLLPGTPFTFSVAGFPQVVPVGLCGPASIAAAGKVAITETLPAGVAATFITTAPSAALVSANLAAGSAAVTVTAGARTTVTFTDVRTGVTIPGDAFQVRYAANLDVGDSVIDITNTGASATAALAPHAGNLCVNAYAFSPDEQLIACCSCGVTPNGLVSLSAKNDLIGNALTVGVPDSIVVKLVATGSPVNETCNSAMVALPGELAPGLGAWGTTLHELPAVPGIPAAKFGITETRFVSATLSFAELTRLTTLCGFIQNNGSGFGVCRSCNLGGLGAASNR